jgi:hypothetical protein
MLLNEFSESNFMPDDRQNLLLEMFKDKRSKNGIPDRSKILKAVERTKPFTRTVYPSGWCGK